MAKPCTPHLIPQAVQLFKLQTATVGGRGELPSPFSGGFKGGILFGKRIPPLVPRRARRSPSRARAGKSGHPFGTPRERLDIAGEQLEELQCLPIALPCARRCRVWICYTIWVTSTTRCRSADLVEVRTNFRLLGHSSMRRAQQCRIRQAVCRQAIVTRASR